MVACRYPLRQLTHFITRQHVAQFRLPDQNDLQKFLRGGLQVGQQADLLQHIGAQILRLVDNQDSAAAACMCVQQVAVECICQHLDAMYLVRIFHTQLITQCSDQLLGGKLRVEHHCNIDIPGQLFHQAAAQGRLAGTHLTGKLHKTTAIAKPIQEMRQRLPMACTHVQKTRIRRDRKGAFCEVEMFQIHGCSASGTRSGNLFITWRPILQSLTGFPLRPCGKKRVPPAPVKIQDT